MHDVVVLLVGGPADGMQWPVPHSVWQQREDILLRLAQDGAELPTIKHRRSLYF